MKSNGTGHDGNAGGHGPEREVAPPPDQVRDLAEGCVRFVQRALGVALDYEPETLPLVDHWIEQARRDAAARPEAAVVVAHAAGAYFGEVVRRRYPSWWRVAGGDPGAFRIELEPVYLSFCPAELCADAIHRAVVEGEEEAAGEQLELDDADREAVTERLAELPPVPEDEFFALSTRLEVIDIAVEAIRARRIAAGDEADAALGPADYED
jgi:hypothetical protein